MNSEQLTIFAGFSELMQDGFFAAQFLTLAFTIVFFVGALALCLMSMRNAARMRRALGEADALRSSMADLTAEMRQLAVQTELAKQETEASAASVRMAAEEARAYVESHAEAREAVEDAAPAEAAEEAAAIDQPAEDRTLSDAKRAAAEPSALLRGLIRRR